MDLSTIRTRLRRQVGNPSITDVADSLLNEHINVAYREIADRYRFNNVRKLCRFSTIASTRRYSVPEDYSNAIRLRDLTNKIRLEKLDSRRLFELTDIDTTGKPTKYTIVKDWIELHPTPDDVYEIEMYYKAEIVELSADGDIPALPTAWHQGILLLSKHYYYVEEGDVPKSLAAFNAYEQWLATKPVELDEEKADYDSGVSIPTLETSIALQDFNTSD